MAIELFPGVFAEKVRCVLWGKKENATALNMLVEDLTSLCGQRPPKDAVLHGYLYNTQTDTWIDVTGARANADHFHGGGKWRGVDWAKLNRGSDVRDSPYIFVGHVALPQAELDKGKYVETVVSLDDLEDKLEDALAVLRQLRSHAV